MTHEIQENAVALKKFCYSPRRINFNKKSAHLKVIDVVHLNSNIWQCFWYLVWLIWKHFLILQLNQQMYAHQHWNVLHKNVNIVVIEKNPQRKGEPSSAKSIASGKNVVQATICGDRCHRNIKILANYSICTVTVVTAQSFDHLFFDRRIPRISIIRF